MKTTQETAISLSVVVPIFNESESIPALFDRLLKTLDSHPGKFEIIAVNDGSQDQSLEVLRKITTERDEVKVVDLRRNYGQTAAIMAGIDHSSNEIIITIDADLQNEPEDIPNLLSKMAEGYDVVSGWRKNRKDAAFRRTFLSRIANFIISKIFKLPLHDYGCTLKAYRRDIIQSVRLYGEMHRFIPIYASWHGAKVTEIVVSHKPRIHGKSNYGLERVLKVILDLIVVTYFDRYLAKPIYLFGGFGILSIFISIITLLTAVGLRIFKDVSLILTPLPALSALLFSIGMVSILLGLLAEVMVRTYYEAQNLATYAVRERFNIPPDVPSQPRP